MSKAMRTAKALDGHIALDVFDYNHQKLCSLFDSDTDAEGQAYDITYTVEKSGTQTLVFYLPWVVDMKRNFRWNYIKSEYIIRLLWNGETEWFYIHAPKKTKDGKGLTNQVTCDHLSSILKTKNLYMVFDKDDDGIGTIQYLIERALRNTGWTLGNPEYIFYEEDGTTEKIRSFGSDGKSGVLALIKDICNLFHAYPVYHSDSHTVCIYPTEALNPQIEMTMGKDLESLSVEYNSDDIVTRLYVEGEYAEHDYVGIDDLNEQLPGLSYLLNFDYFKELGLFTATHQQALDDYIEAIVP